MFEIGDYVRIADSGNREGTIVNFIPPDVQPSEELMLDYFGAKAPKALSKPSPMYRLIIRKSNLKGHLLYPLSINSAKKIFKV